LQVILTQHSGNGIPLSRELKQREVVIGFVGNML
jgi:hypothetical protein